MGREKRAVRSLAQEDQHQANGESTVHTTNRSKQTAMSSDGRSVTSSDSPMADCSQCRCDWIDRAVILLLEWEEDTLGSIIGECGGLMQLAEDQATEMADYLDDQA